MTVSLGRLPAATREAIADLLGAERVLGETSRVPTVRLASALGLPDAADLREVVETLRGPMPDRRAERAATRRDREALWAWLARETGRLKFGSRGALEAWVETQRAVGVWGGIEAHRRRLEQAIAVLGHLPADGIALASLANDGAGDPHALDRGRRLTAIVLDAVATALGVPRETDAESTRSLWEAVGVAPDPLSSTVLVLGLRGGARTPLDQWLVAAAEAGQAVVLSLDNLRRWPLPALPPGSPLFVVENPSIVAEAARLDWSGPPLVCSSGRPTVAVVTLLRQLGAAGACIRQHADFDPVGVAITRWLADRAGTTPWRMTSADYLAAAGEANPRFTGPIPDTPWDPSLATAMRTHGSVVYEEAVRLELLGSMRER